MGNKNDLLEQKQVSIEDVQKLCTSKHIQCLEVSAKSGDNILKGF